MALCGKVNLVPGDCDVINSVVCLTHPGSTYSDALPPARPGHLNA